MGENLRVLNRDVIKYIAMFTMLLNHIAHALLTKGTPLYEVFEDIGYFTAPVMCFFLVEGYQYTRSKLKYGLRLFLFALVSQLPFFLAMRRPDCNMLFTLFCCFLILVVMERVENPFLRGILCLFLMAATLWSDWPLLAAFFTILFARSWGDKRGMAFSFGGGYLLFVLLNVQNYMNGAPGDWTPYAVTHAFLAGLGILAAGVVTLVCYNGERTKRGQNFSKWFFYLFYPLHLLLLYFIKQWLGSGMMTVMRFT